MFEIKNKILEIKYKPFNIIFFILTFWKTESKDKNRLGKIKFS